MSVRICSVGRCDYWARHHRTRCWTCWLACHWLATVAGSRPVKLCSGRVGLAGQATTCGSSLTSCPRQRATICATQPCCHRTILGGARTSAYAMTCSYASVLPKDFVWRALHPSVSKLARLATIFHLDPLRRSTPNSGKAGVQWLLGTESRDIRVGSITTLKDSAGCLGCKVTKPCHDLVAGRFRACCSTLCRTGRQDGGMPESTRRTASRATGKSCRR